MSVLPPRGGPSGGYLKPGEGIEFLEALKQHVIDNIGPELLQDRRDIWDSEPDDGHAPEWMYLKGKTLEAHKNFHHWCQVIKQDLQCDDRACSSSR